MNENMQNDDFASLFTLWDVREVHIIATAFCLILGCFFIAPDFADQSQVMLISWILVTLLAWLRGLVVDARLVAGWQPNTVRSLAAFFDFLLCLALFSLFGLFGNLFAALPVIGVYLLAVLLYPAHLLVLSHDISASRDTALGLWMTVVALLLIASVSVKFAGFYLLALPLALTGWLARRDPQPFRYSGAVLALVVPLVLMFCGLDNFVIAAHYTVCSLVVFIGFAKSDKDCAAYHFSPRRHFWAALLVPNLVALCFDSIYFLDLLV